MIDIKEIIPTISEDRETQIKVIATILEGFATTLSPRILVIKVSIEHGLHITEDQIIKVAQAFSRMVTDDPDLLDSIADSKHYLSLVSKEYIYEKFLNWCMAHPYITVTGIIILGVLIIYYNISDTETDEKRPESV